jgi:D-alanyl-D-alanine dipeptidase
MKWIFLLLSLNGFAQTTLIAAPEVIKIPVKENEEKLFDLKNQKIILWGASPEIPNNQDYTFLRISVYQKLLRANKMLPKGIHFCIYEAYRSLELQNQLFQAQYQRVKQEYPNWTHPQLFTETTRLVSPVINLDGTKNITPHSTGGAIDIYLVDDNNQALDMGIHPKDWGSDKDGKLSATDSAFISEEAKKNRKLMLKILSKVGLVNYPTEYWHWSYGDKYWAFKTHKTNAIFNSI